MSTQNAQRHPEFPPLVLLLDALSRDPVHGAVPRELWDTALYRPLLEFVAHPGKELRARLTRLSFALAGGHGEPPELLPLVCELLHAGSLIIDDIEDDSAERRAKPALHRAHGVPLALNAGNFLYFVPFVLLARLPVSQRAQLAMHRCMANTLLDCHRGQALDISARISTLAPRDVSVVVAKTTELKTGRLMGMAAQLAALAAEADDARVHTLQVFGEKLGTALQMLDDLGGITSDARAEKGLEDLRLERPTWIWAWLSELGSDGELRQHQLSCRRATRDPAAANELRLQLRERVAEHGRAAVHKRLRDASAGLRESVPSAALFTELERELTLLERSYV